MEEIYEGLACSKVKTVGGYKLSADDPGNFTDKLMFLEQRKDLPGSYPEGADGDLDKGFTVKSRSQSAASKPAAAGAPTDQQIQCHWQAIKGRIDSVALQCGRNV